MLSIAICDDNQAARLSLRSALERLLETRREQARMLEFSSGEGLWSWLARHQGEVDLVFLDMEMGQLDGMETARRLRRDSAEIQLVFVTGFSHRVFDGYAVGALGYLLKPPKEAQLEDILDRCTAALRRETGAVFLCRSGEITYRIPRNRILYFASDRRQVTCVSTQRSFTFYGKLDQVAREVGPDFVRIHQRYLVRAGAVERVSGSEVMLGDVTLPISRSCQKEAMMALTRAALEG